MENHFDSKLEPPGAVSRRRFLQGAGAGLGLTLSGVRGAGQPATQAGAPQAGNWNSKSEFIYGTHFYHPHSGPQPDQFRAMIDDIVNKYNFNIIRIYPPWDYYNPKRGEFRFDDLEQLFNVCDEYKIRVLMTIILESSPYWLKAEHPETRYVDARGLPRHLGPSGGDYTGGLPGLCLDWEVVREEGFRFIQELAKMSAAHPSLYAYDVWNEPEMVRDLGGPGHWETVPDNLFCYCQQTLAAFRIWLQKRYGSLDRLNQAWIRGYSSWETVEPPRTPIGMYTDWMDWRQFTEGLTVEYMKFRAQAIRSVDKEHLLESHANHFPPIHAATLAATQNWRLAETLDVFGCSFYPNWFSWPMSSGAAVIELTRASVRGKDFWITELQGGHGNEGYWRSAPMRPRELRTWNWMAVGAGAKAIIYWTYIAEGTGREASGFGLTTRSGAPTERIEEAAKANRLIQARWDIIKDHHPKPEVAMLFDQDNALLTFGGNAKEDPSMQSSAGYYQALWVMDFWVDFIEPTEIGHPQYKVIVVPWNLIGKDAMLDSLRAFVENGGTLIVETAFARFNQKYYFNPDIPGRGLHTIFGYRELESLMINDGRFAIEALNQAPADDNATKAEIEFSSPIRARVKAHTYLTPIEILSATPLAKCYEWTVAATKAVGRGRVYYIGTNLGASIAAGDQGGIEVLRAMITPVIKPPVSCSGKLRPRIIQSSRRGLLTVFNDTNQPQTATINLPAGYHHATDIYSGKKYAITGNKMELSVPFRDVSAFDLE